MQPFWQTVITDDISVCEYLLNRRHTFVCSILASVIETIYFIIVYYANFSSRSNAISISLQMSFLLVLFLSDVSSVFFCFLMCFNFFLRPATTNVKQMQHIKTKSENNTLNTKPTQNIDII